MTGSIWAVIIIAAVVVLGAVARKVLDARRTRRLQNRFGPEYDRTAQMSAEKWRAESELAAREKRRAPLDIHPLDGDARARYAERWRRVQHEFVDSPAGALARADALVNSVMTDQGYPIAGFGLRAADISVDHPQVVENYRTAHRVLVAMGQGVVTTEQQRQAMQHYRTLLVDLLGADQHPVTTTSTMRR